MSPKRKILMPKKTGRVTRQMARRAVKSVKEKKVSTMRIYTCNDFEGHWPVGTAAVIVAKSKRKAQHLLAAEMVKEGLKPDGTETLVEIDTSVLGAHILNDGEY